MHPRHGSCHWTIGPQGLPSVGSYLSIDTSACAMGLMCPSHTGGRTLGSPGIPHRTMSVTDPAGPSSQPMADIDRLLPTSMGIPSVLFTPLRRRRDLNPSHGRDRAVCFRTTPRRHRVAPAGIEPATSGSKVQRPSPAETPGLVSGTVFRDALWRELQLSLGEVMSTGSEDAQRVWSWSILCGSTTSQNAASTILMIVPSLGSSRVRG